MRQGEKFLSDGTEAALFLVGQNRRGNWVVKDQAGRRGGLFAPPPSNMRCSRTAIGRSW